MSEIDRKGTISMGLLVSGSAAVFAGASWDRGMLGVCLALALIAVGALGVVAIAWLEPRS
ncbi:MAG: hypothetical protein PGN16_04270 [Sphingomonas phyllosphaerae]|uniref:hypothetical protein n=1 Tax=Sphingomonas phyllosphaerae TaxID=257003 RepID=UPI002FF62D43